MKFSASSLKFVSEPDELQVQDLHWVSCRDERERGEDGSLPPPGRPLERRSGVQGEAIEELFWSQCTTSSWPPPWTRCSLVSLTTICGAVKPTEVGIRGCSQQHNNQKRERTRQVWNKYRDRDSRLEACSRDWDKREWRVNGTKEDIPVRYYLIAMQHKLSPTKMPTKPQIAFCRGHMVVLPIGGILKPFAGLSCLPCHQLGLLKVEESTGMDEEADRKATQRREDAVTHSTILPGHHPIFLWGELSDIILGFNTEFTGVCPQPPDRTQSIQRGQRCCEAWRL